MSPVLIALVTLTYIHTDGTIDRREVIELENVIVSLILGMPVCKRHDEEVRLELRDGLILFHDHW